MSKLKRGIKNSSYLAVGQFISQAVSLIGFIYIAKMLGPENFGIYNIVTAFVGVFALLTFSGINKVVLRDCSKNISRIKEILERTIGVRMLFSVFALIVCIFVSFFVDYSSEIKIYIVIFSFDLLFNGLRESINIIYQAKQKIKYIALFNVIKTILIVSLSVIFLFLGHGVLSLFFIHAVITLLVLIANYLVSRNIVVFNVFSKPIFDKPLLKQGASFSLIGFLSVLSTKVDLLMLSFLASPLEVGIYAVAFKIVGKGQVVRNSVSTSFFPIFAERFDKGAVPGGVLLVKTIQLGVLALMPALVIAYFANDIITVLLGEEYSESAEMLQVLIFYLIASHALYYLCTTPPLSFSL